MSSYAGRHRTPSSNLAATAPATTHPATTHPATAGPNRARRLAVLATAGAVIAAPIAVAGPAQAASGRTWDRLAECESGGNWSINTGNGYYGGLQFSGGTWRAHGGGAYASSAHRASRMEQITIAERVLDAQGWGAWPACSRKLGLGRAEAAGSASVSRSTQRKAIAKKAVARKATAKKAARAKATTRKVRTSATRTLRKEATSVAAGRYVVRSGDTLSRIASRSKVAGGWKAVYRANRAAIGSNPNRIQVGQSLVLPR